MTVRNTLGSSSECGTWSRRFRKRTQSMQALRTLRYSNRWTEEKVGRSFLDCVAMELDRNGSLVREECACIRLSWIKAIQSGFTSPFPRQERFALTTAAQRGSPSTKD